MSLIPADFKDTQFDVSDGTPLGLPMQAKLVLLYNKYDLSVSNGNRLIRHLFAFLNYIVIGKIKRSSDYDSYCSLFIYKLGIIRPISKASFDKKMKVVEKFNQRNKDNGNT